MMDAKVIFKETAGAIKNLIEGWKYLRETDVVVGITESSDAAREGGVTNAQLLYLHQNGIPSHNIPPRPVLKPAIQEKETNSAIKSMLRAGAARAMAGDVSGAEAYYNKAGMLGQNACRKYISEGGNLAPNAASTIARKGSSTPLVDTGSMLGSITYEVRKKR